MIVYTAEKVCGWKKENWFIFTIICLWYGSM